MQSYHLVRELSDFPQEELGTICAPMLLEDFYEEVKNIPALAFDFETTGLRPFHGSRAFSLALSDGVSSWYWDRRGRDLPDELQKLFLDPAKTFISHNAKYDSHILHESFGIDIAGVVYCSAIGARIAFNDHPSYGLGECLKRIGLSKDDGVMAYIKEHGLTTKEEIPFKKEGRKLMFFDRVPLRLLQEYACRDAWGAFKLYEHQLKRIREIDALLPDSPKAESIVKLEQDLGPCVVKMERGGVRVDLKYCQEAIEFLSGTMEEKKKSFLEITGNEFTDSWQKLSKVFAGEQLKWGRTEKGNPSFSSDILETFEHPAAKLVVGLRNEKSRIDFFATFLAEADSSGFVHPSFNSGGTATRRFSSSGPNFQNLTNDEDAPPETWSPRRALIPPEDCCILSLDYSQQEYMMALDYAGELEIIEQVRNGADIHQATAEMMGVTRRYAKTLNFMLLYGGGVAKLCMALFKPTVDEETLQAICFIHLYQMNKHDDYKRHLELVRPLTQDVIDQNLVELKKAQDLRELYFSKLPRMKAFIEKVTEIGHTRGYVHSWAGMRFWCNPRYAYTMPNRIIQGGGADVGKQAMVKCDRILSGTKSRLFLPVHDELDFYLHRQDLNRGSDLVHAMESVYKGRHLTLKVGVSHSWKNLGDLEDGGPLDARAIGA